MKNSTRRESGRSPSPGQPDIEPCAEIHFYRANEKPYGAFSNLFRSPITLEGCIFPTAEHAYQAGKARKKAVREWILSAPTPALVAMSGHGLYSWDVVPTWAQIKFERMRKVLRAKFTQHQDLQALLLSTGDARLVEVGRVNNNVNRTWGEVNGKGKNMLGVLLMELRAELRKNVSSKDRKLKPKTVTSLRESEETLRIPVRLNRKTNGPPNDFHAIRR
jgi:ribA/ribD-fused uncharacterized protein